MEAKAKWQVCPQRDSDLVSEEASAASRRGGKRGQPQWQWLVVVGSFKLVVLVGGEDSGISGA